MSEPTEPEEGGTVWDAPNQQVVRPDQSPPWEEGEGGGVDPGSPGEPTPEATGLDAMTKDELLAYAQDIGATPANAGMTKDELRASIDKAES